MSNPMDLLNQAKDAFQEGGVDGLVATAREAIADRVDDIPVVGDQLAEMISPGHVEEEASAESEEATEEEETEEEESEEESEEEGTEEDTSDEEATEEESTEEEEAEATE